MEVKDREIWIEEDRLYLGEEGIIHITAVGKKDKKDVINLRDAYIKMANMVRGKVNLLIDVSKVSKPSLEARRVVQNEIFQHEKTGKIALWGANPTVRVIASFIMGTTRKEDMRFFETKEEAFAWLKK